MSTDDQESEKELNYRLKKMAENKKNEEKLLSEKNLNNNSTPQEPFLPNYQNTPEKPKETEETKLKTDPIETPPIPDPKWNEIVKIFETQGSDKFTISNNQIQDKHQDILIQKTTAGQIEISTKKANPDLSVLNAMVAHYKTISQKTGVLTCIISAASNPEITATLITKLLDGTPPPPIKPIINDPTIRTALEKEETDACKNAKNLLKKEGVPSESDHPKPHSSR